MKKTTKRLGRPKRKARSGKSTTTRLQKAFNSQAKLALAKAREAKKMLRAKLLALKAEFKEKLEQIKEAAYTKALQEFERLHLKKLIAKNKFLAAVEEKFEKKYAKKINKKVKKHRKNKISASTNKTTQRQPTTHRTGKRGRPRKAA